MKKTYKSLTNAYAAVEKAKAVPFIVDRSYDEMVVRALDHAHMKASKRNLAVWNLVKFENTLCALEETKDGFKWTAIGTFDSDGLLYPMARTNAYDPAQEYEDLMEGYKPRTRKPTTTKGSANMTKKEVRSWAWKQANGDRAKYDELCKSKGIDNHR